MYSFFNKKFLKYTFLTLVGFSFHACFLDGESNTNPYDEVDLNVTELPGVFTMDALVNSCDSLTEAQVQSKDSILGLWENYYGSCQFYLDQEYEIEPYKENIALLNEAFENCSLFETNPDVYKEAFHYFIVNEENCKNFIESEMKSVYNLLEREFLYFDQLEPLTSYNSLQELVDSAHSIDRYTRYTAPEKAEETRVTYTESPIVGIIGIYHEVQDKQDPVEPDTLVIYRVVENSAADGILQWGDQLIKANGLPVAGIGNPAKAFNDTTKKTQDVDLVVKRGAELLSFTITKKSVRLPTVFTDSLFNDAISSHDIGVIEVKRFSSRSNHNDGTRSEFREALDLTSHFDHVIIDLRGNGGGVVSQCTDMADDVVPSGVMYYEVDRENGKTDTTTVKAKTGGKAEGRALSILQDGRSASCTEIMIASIIKNTDIITYGETTYGKGVGQSLPGTENDGLLKVTSLALFDNTWTSYDDVGIPPLVQVDRDSAMTVAANAIRGVEAAPGSAGKIQSRSQDRGKAYDGPFEALIED